MQITVPDDLNLIEKAEAAGFEDVGEYVADLVERAEIQAALRRGLEAVEKGDVQPLNEAMSDIRRELGFPAE